MVSRGNLLELSENIMTSKLVRLNKSYDVDFNVVADGSGLWGMEAGTDLKFTTISVILKMEYVDNEIVHQWSEVQAVHNKRADQFGLAYTDKAVERGVNQFCADHDEISDIVKRLIGSEQGMQGTWVLSCDAEPVAMYDVDRLIELGYEPQDMD